MDSGAGGANGEAIENLVRWLVSVDESSGLVRRIEKLQPTGSDPEVVFEGSDAMSVAYGIPPGIAETILAGASEANGAGALTIDPTVLDACRRYASIPYAFSYWQGYADAVAAFNNQGLGQLGSPG